MTCTHSLIAVSKSSHTRHHTEHVVVRGIDTDSGARVEANRVVRKSEKKSGVIDTRQVASTRRLVLFRLKSKGVDVDTNRRDIGVVLVGLDQVEVGTFTDLEAIVAVKLDERSDDRVLARHAFNTGDRVARLEDRAIPPVGVVERLLALPGVDDGVIARDEAVSLDNPDEFLTRVVEVELELVGARSDRLTTSELEDINEVLVRDLGELAALIGIKVDVVDVEGSSGKTSLGNTVADRVGVRASAIVPAEVVEGIELEVNADLVVLERNEGEGKTRVAAEPELEGHVQGVHGGAAANTLGHGGGTSVAVVVARNTALDNDVGKLRDVTDHLGVTSLLAGLLGELIPDLEPVTIVLVNALTADFEFDVRNEVVANPVEPAELRTRTILGHELDLRESGLEVDAVDQVTIALNGTSDLLAEVGGTIEGVLNGLHRKVSVATVYDLEDKEKYPPFRDI